MSGPIFAADGGPYGPEDFSEDPFEPFIGPAPCPRTCCGCDGFHHWIEHYDEATGFAGFICKHCDALSDMCDRCDDPIGRVVLPSDEILCDTCVDEMLAEGP